MASTCIDHDVRLCATDFVGWNRTIAGPHEVCLVRQMAFDCHATHLAVSSPVHDLILLFDAGESPGGIILPSFRSWFDYPTRSCISAAPPEGQPRRRP